jgi:hypothetical protein
MPTILPELLMAVVATWLGATAVVRAPRYYVARVFGLAMALAALWSAARVVGRLTESEQVARVLVAVEAGTAALATAILLHFTLAYCHSGRWSRAQRLTLGVAYAVGFAVAIQSLIDREHPLAIRNPHTVLGLPGAAIAWGWIALRAAILLATLWWAWQARMVAADRARRERLLVLLLALGMATAGVIAIILGRQFGAVEWPGTIALAVSLGLATYAVAAGHVFRTPAAARRSFAVSLGSGLLTAVYIGLLLALDRLARVALGTDAPVVTTLAVILTIALFDPARERLREVFDRGSDRRDLPYRRLVRAFGGELLTAQHPQEAIGPALAQLCQSLGIGAAAIHDNAGAVVAEYGAREDLAAGPALVLPLTTGEASFGRAIFGRKRNHLPYGAGETDLLRDAATFIAASLQLAERQVAQAAALETLAGERAALAAREAALAAALEAVVGRGVLDRQRHALGEHLLGDRLRHP